MATSNIPCRSVAPYADVLQEGWFLKVAEEQDREVDRVPFRFRNPNAPPPQAAAGGRGSSEELEDGPQAGDSE